MIGAPREEVERLGRLLALVAREDEHLLAVRQRLLGDDCAVSEARAEALLADATGIDRLESFGAKFARMQDTVVDKLLPTLLRAAIDNLGVPRKTVASGPSARRTEHSDRDISNG